jgi:serine/threonine protein kinase
VIPIETFHKTTQKHSYRDTMTQTQINSDKPQLKLQSDPKQTPQIRSADYTIWKDQILANGEWCTVYVGEFGTETVTGPKQETSSQLLAIKMPKSKRSSLELINEANILSNLHKFKSAENYVVGFYGLDPDNGAIVLTKMDLTLRDYVTDVLEKEDHRSEMLHRCFSVIAQKLVGCLTWLHNVARAVHGDIKPGNILMLKVTSTFQQNQGSHGEDIFPYKVVLTDFGSSRFINDLQKSKGGNTWEYIAPENMNSAASQTPPTLESDIWAMGISLLTVITGRRPYPRLSWPAMFSILREGDPIRFERESSSVVRERLDSAGRLVDMIRPALEKNPEKRTNTVDWGVKLTSEAISQS